MKPKTVQELGEAGFAGSISRDGLPLQIGPFAVSIRVELPELLSPLFRLYAAYPLVFEDGLFSFRVRLSPRRRLSRRLRREVRFTVDGLEAHDDLPAAQALAVLEWGINLAVAARSHAYLTLHAAVLEKHGDALLLPAAPGHGKSTLCAALAHRGWRLLSDEFALLRPGGSQLVPIPRPIALKNQSIAVMRDFAPDALLGPEVHGTRKGTVAHVAPPPSSVHRQSEAVPARRIVFPRWSAEAALQLTPVSAAHGFISVAQNAFNYELLGETGFDTVHHMIRQCDCFHLSYSDLDEAVAALDRLARRDES
jgi:HprK-related kinase A